MRALSAAAAPRSSRKARRIHKALAVHGRHLGPVSHGQGGGCLAGLRGVRFFGRRPGRKCIICKPQKTEKGE